MQKIFITVVASLLIVFSTFGETESESSQILSSTVSSGSNLDIDGNGRFDALTDGLLVLRSMFGLTGAPLISGVVAADAVYTDAEDIQSRITGLGNLLDIDNNGNVDAGVRTAVTAACLVRSRNSSPRPHPRARSEPVA